MLGTRMWRNIFALQLRRRPTQSGIAIRNQHYRNTATLLTDKSIMIPYRSSTNEILSTKLSTPKGDIPH